MENNSKWPLNSVSMPTDMNLKNSHCGFIRRPLENAQKSPKEFTFHC
jgi:hypothetical protein